MTKRLEIKRIWEIIKNKTIPPFSFTPELKEWLGTNVEINSIKTKNKLFIDKEETTEQIFEKIQKEDKNNNFTNFFKEMMKKEKELEEILQEKKEPISPIKWSYWRHVCPNESSVNALKEVYRNVEKKMNSLDFSKEIDEFSKSIIQELDEDENFFQLTTKRIEIALDELDEHEKTLEKLKERIENFHIHDLAKVYPEIYDEIERKFRLQRWDFTITDEQYEAAEKEIKEFTHHHH